MNTQRAIYIILLCFLFTGKIYSENEYILIDSTDSIHLIARPHGDSIVLRWAPDNYTTWRLMQVHGIILERRIAGTNAFKPVRNTPVKQYSLMDFETKSDTENPHIIAVAEALYGEATPTITSDKGPMARAKEQLTEQEQRYFLAVLNADLSAEAAQALGWRYIDKSVQRDGIYEYRLRIKNEISEKDLLVSAPLRVRPSDPFRFGAVYGVELVESDHRISLLWPSGTNEKRYTGYYLEVSDNGHDFRREPKWPIIKENSEDGFRHEIILENNYEPRHYRLRGINSFGEISEATKALRGQGVDLTPPASVLSVSATDREEGSWVIKWQPSETESPDLAGYVVTRGASYEAQFYSAHQELIPKGTHRFIDSSPTPYEANYYQVHSVDTSGNVSKGTIGLGYWHDQEAPAAPTGLSGKVDSIGNVFLIWEPGMEPDLHGYRVYVSHARDREFLQVSEDIVRQNYFFDSTRLNTLNETIYYRLVALDNNFNPSDYGEIVTIRKPDKIAPTPAVFSDYSARGDIISLSWHPSKSKDVVEQALWRKSTDDEWEQLVILGRSAKTYTDTSTNIRTHYYYKIRTTDDAKLFIDSRPIEIMSGQRSRRDQDINLRTVKTNDESVLKWDIPQNLSETIVYYGKVENKLRPLRRVRSPISSWTLSNGQRIEDQWAVQLVFRDGSRSSIVELP